MCSPKLARELSKETGGYFPVTKLDPHNPDQDQKTPKGQVLQGFINGEPIYYTATGIHAQLMGTLTCTSIGPRYVQQPIESCFSRRATADDAGGKDDDSGYVSLGPGDGGEPCLTPNRAFCNTWFTVGRSPLGGYGVFARVDISPSTHILLEHPLMVISSYSQIHDRYAALTADEKVVFDSLHSYHPTNKDPLLRVWNANHFDLWGSEGVFPVASNFNHACQPMRNTSYRWDFRRRVMTFTTTKYIKNGEEIFISYGSNRLTLFTNFGFICRCGGCADQEYESSWAMQF